MTNLSNSKTILYFEDEAALSELFIEYLSECGFTIIHYDSYPENGLEDIKKRINGKPDFVLMDLSLPGISGAQICHELRTDYLDRHVPVIFVSGQMSEKDILEAYDAGADDYLIKPIRLKELRVKLENFSRQQEEHFNQQEQMSGAQKMAFEAMTTSSELGEILRFHEESYLVANLDELMSLLLKAIAKFSLKSSILVFGEKESFYRDDGQSKPLEQKTLHAFKDQQRIYSWKNRTFFNYEHFSILIRDMPINDEERYGILKDQLCLLFNGVDARIKALLIEKSNQLKAITMKVAADTIANMVMEIESDNVELSQKFEAIILKMESNISADILMFNLLENEEKVLLEHIVSAIKESSEVFELSLQKEKQYKEIMTSLLRDLLSSN